MDKYLDDEAVENAMAALKILIDELHKNAYELVERHWIWVRNMEKRYSDWGNKSSLQIRCKIEGKENTSIRLDWQHLEWRGSKARGTRTALRKSISKPRDSYKYNSHKLLAYAKEWEKNNVLLLEEELAEIRRRARHLNTAITALKNAQGIRRK